MKKAIWFRYVHAVNYEKVPVTIVKETDKCYLVRTEKGILKHVKKELVEPISENSLTSSAINTNEVFASEFNI